MAGGGRMIGGKFAQLGKIISKVSNKSRIGVCLDTCHAFVAGYDIRIEEGWNKTLQEFDKDIGLQYLKAIHLNDSKVELDSKKDWHENIGLGYIKLKPFKCIMADPRFQNIPIILETPHDEDHKIWRLELDLVYKINRNHNLDNTLAMKKIRLLTLEMNAGKTKKVIKPPKDVQSH